MHVLLLSYPWTTPVVPPVLPLDYPCVMHVLLLSYPWTTSVLHVPAGLPCVIPELPLAYPCATPGLTPVSPLSGPATQKAVLPNQAAQQQLFVWPLVPRPLHPVVPAEYSGTCRIQQHCQLTSTTLLAPGTPALLDTIAASQTPLCLQVPPDFNPGCIAEVDDSTAEKLAYTLAVAVMERAHALRHQVCILCCHHCDSRTPWLLPVPTLLLTLEYP